jgi:hypothetical protein
MKPFKYLLGASRRGPFTPGMSETLAFSLFNAQFFIFYFFLVPAASPSPAIWVFCIPGCFCATDRSRPTFSSRFAPAIEDSDPIGESGLSSCFRRKKIGLNWFLSFFEGRD